MDSCHGRSELPRSEPALPRSSQECPSSPPSIAGNAGARKPRRPPTVTPRSFKRFFTPRSMLNGSSNPGTVRTNRQALKNLNSPAVNRLGPAFTRSPKPVEDWATVTEFPDVWMPHPKRKLSFSSIGSPLQSSPSRKIRIKTPIHNDEDDGIAVPVKDVKIPKEVQHHEINAAPAGEPLVPVSPIRRSSALQTSGGLYLRSVLGPRANRTTIRSNSGTGWSPASILYPRDLNLPYYRLERSDFELLFPAWR